MNLSKTLKEKIELLPGEPGVYRFFDQKGRLIYVGKAKNLKNRARSYFTAAAKKDPRIWAWVDQIKDLAWIVTGNEIEALILEDHLIKTNRPRYNIELKDDKSYPYFRLSVGELYPRLSLVRNPKKDRALYFGPFVAVKTARAALTSIRKAFPLRQSKFELDGTKTHRPCLNYQMKRCLAPCAGLVSPEEYGKLVERVVWLLKGNYEGLILELKQDMLARSEEMRFEEAALLRDQMRALERTFARQRVLTKERIDRDILALVRQGGFAGVQVLFVRGGILLSDDFLYFAKGGDYSDQELIRSALSKLYFAGEKPLPKEIWLPTVNDDILILGEYFSQRRGTKVALLNPQRGDKMGLMAMAKQNGEENLRLRLNVEQAEEQILSETMRVLKLTKLPQRMECFDISNTMGKHSVASMAVFEGGKAQSSQYRIYKIRTVEGPNDFASLAEVMSRRYKKEADQPWPDLIVIDGGLGQLRAAQHILEGLGWDPAQTDLIGLAKGRSLKRAHLKAQDLGQSGQGGPTANLEEGVEVGDLAGSDEVRDSARLIFGRDASLLPSNKDDSSLPSGSESSPRTKGNGHPLPSTPGGGLEELDEAGEDTADDLPTSGEEEYLGGNEPLEEGDLDEFEGDSEFGGIEGKGVKTLKNKGADEEEDFEYVVKPGRKNPVHLKKNSSTLFLLQRLRDEAHRFAITHHRKLRAKAATHSGLEDIEGIGPKKRAVLLKHFKSLAAIKAATPEELVATPGLTPKDAQAVWDFFGSES